MIVTDPEPNVVAYLKIRKAELVPKSQEELALMPDTADLRQMLGLPKLTAGETSGGAVERSDGEAWLDMQGQEAYEDIQREIGRLDASGDPSQINLAGQLSNTRLDSSSSGAEDCSSPSSEDEIRFAKRGRWFIISTSAITSPNDSAEADIGEQVKSCFDRIKGNLFLTIPRHTNPVLGAASIPCARM